MVKVLFLFIRFLSLSTIVLMLAVLISFAVPFVKDANSFKIITGALSITQIMVELLKSVIPTVINGKDYSGWIVVAGLFFSKRLVLDDIEYRLSEKLENLKLQEKYAAFKDEMHLPDDSMMLAPLEEKMKTLDPNDINSRAELLKLFAETKKKLDSMVREVAFLSIDIVGSTNMKEGEDKTFIELTFKEYKEFVTKILEKYNSLKAAWTPDGVMICFSTADDGVGAAKDVIKGLEYFNREKKSIKMDFKVRCGVNVGQVQYDQSTPMEEMSDHVIDVAGHMQKYAAHDGIYISKETYEALEREKDGFKHTEEVVDGYEVYLWELPAK